MFVVSGDQTLIDLELGTLLDQLVGDADRAFMVEDFDASNVDLQMLAVADAMNTLPLFGDKRIVVVRNVHKFPAESLDVFVESIRSMPESTEVVVTITGRLPKALSDVFKSTGATTIGASIGTKKQDRLDWVESHLVEEGLTCAPDALRLITRWLGEDASKLAGLIDTLKSTFGADKKIALTDVEPLLGEAGGVAPWDLTDAIESGDTTTALVNLHRMMGGGEAHPMQILALLSNRYAQMMRLDGASVQTSADAAQVLGMKEFPAGKVLDAYRRLGSAGVAQAMSLMATADVDMRGGKEWEPEWVVEVLVARLSRLGGQAAVTRRGASSKRRS